MLALLGALKEEIAGVRRGMVVEKAFAENGCHIYLGKYGGKPVLLARTGMGREQAESAARLILERYPVSAMVSLGFAGGLTEESKVGDIVLCSTLYCNDRHGNSDAPLHSDANLVALSSQALTGKVTRLRQGKSVTVERPVSTPEAKSALGKSLHADVVEMESYWIGRIASEKHVPFVAVRAISDTAQYRLPPFEIMNMGGGIRWKRAMPYFLSHPHMLKLLTLYRSARRAEESLTAFIDYLIAKL